MFFGEQRPGPYDLRWRMFGTNVRVAPLFWLIAAILRFDLLDRGIELFLVWMLCVFLSILVHEFGHVCMFRAFGASSEVVLQGGGGLTIPDRNLHSHWQRIAVSLAGPATGFLFLAVMALLLAVRDPSNVGAVFEMCLSVVGVEPAGPHFFGFPFLVEAGIRFMILINVFWGLFNLLPIWPLDGGQVSYDLLDHFMRNGQGKQLALGISMGLAGLLAIQCVLGARGVTLIPYLPSLGGMYNAILFAVLAIGSYEKLQRERQRPWREEW